MGLVNPLNDVGSSLKNWLRDAAGPSFLRDSQALLPTSRLDIDLLRVISSTSRTQAVAELLKFGSLNFPFIASLEKTLLLVPQPRAILFPPCTYEISNENYICKLKLF